MLPHAASDRTDRALTSRLRTRLTALLGGLVAAGTAAATVLAAVPAHAANPPTPGDFRGFGFDQCEAPSSAAMQRWMDYSPYTAVGIYISGASRGCRTQANLTPAWVAQQQAIGWRLLPITLGPQASCHPKFPRYGNDPKINPSSANNYWAAQAQGATEGLRAVQAAQRLGIAARSTLWYDLEGFDSTNTACRVSAMAFLHGWTNKVTQLGYVSGTYSSAASGIKAIDDERVRSPRRWNIPRRVWIADWDGRPNTSSRFIRATGWTPYDRMKQYRGGHREAWGGVTINIDSNYLALGNSVPGRADRARPVNVNLPAYYTLVPGTRYADQVRALKLLLREKGFWPYANLNGTYGGGVVESIARYQRAAGLPVSRGWSTRHWVSLLGNQGRTGVKYGSVDDRVWALQRALRAIYGPRVALNGIFSSALRTYVSAYQARVGLPRTAHATASTWDALRAGRY